MDKYLEGLLNYIKNYENKKVDTLFSEFHISSKAKSKNFMLSQALISNYEGREIWKAKFEKYKINLKTIQLKENGKPKEAMSFAPINYQKIVTETWENSEFNNYLSNSFLFFIFKIKDKQNIFVQAFIWNIPKEDLNGEIKLVWEDTKKKISEGTIIKTIENKKVIMWFLTEKVTNICHVRPHGSNGSDVAKLPVKDKKTGYEYASKQSFWFNHSYLEKIVENHLEEHL